MTRKIPKIDPHTHNARKLKNDRGPADNYRSNFVKQIRFLGLMRQNWIWLVPCEADYYYLHFGKPDWNMFDKKDPKNAKIDSRTQNAKKLENDGGPADNYRLNFVEQIRFLGLMRQNWIWLVPRGAENYYLHFGKPYLNIFDKSDPGNAKIHFRTHRTPRSSKMIEAQLITIG